MDAQPMVIPVDAAPCGQVRPFIDFLVERFASQPEGDLKLSAQARSAIRDSRPGYAWSRLGTIPRSRVLHPCYRAARRLSAFDGQRRLLRERPFLARSGHSANWRRPFRADCVEK